MIKMYCIYIKKILLKNSNKKNTFKKFKKKKLITR